jgi:hypothetical protein
MKRGPRSSSTFIVLMVLAGLGLTAGILWAIETGEVKGRVTDEQGSGLPGVEISASGPALQGTRVVVSSNDGHFHLPLLPVGAYTLTFKLQGFNTVKQENVVVRLGMTTTLGIKMPIATIQQTVVVTAEPPLIDKTSTDTSFNLGATDLQKVPAQNRTIMDAVKLAPGVAGVRMNTRRGTAAEGQPSFRGEGEEGNAWIVDGLSVSGVRIKDAGLKLNYDSIEEIQVISDSFSPEFGSAFGGIINMVTKSGSNAFRGEASLVFQNKALQAGRESQLSIVSEPEYFSDANWYANLGGPIIKDKLWFFLSENYYRNTQETNDGTLDYLAVPGGERTTSNNNFFSKLTFALSPNHNLSVTAIWNKSFPLKGVIGLPDMNEENKTQDLIFRANYKGILSDTMFVEAGLGHVRRESFKHPVDGDLGPAMYYVEDLAQNIHNSYGNVTDNETRLDASAKLTKYFETETFGHHELILGFEYYRVSSDFVTTFSGQAEDPFPGDGFDAGTKYNFGSWKEGARTPTLLREYGMFSFVNSSRGIGLFFKDKVSFDRFTLMIGLRSQTQLCLGNEGQTLWSWGLGDFLSPRFSLTADLTKDGKNILKIGWGRFSDMIATMPLGFFNPGAGLKYRDYSWTGPDAPSESQIHDPANWAYSNEPPTYSFEVAPGIKPNFVSRFLLEFDRRLGRDWAVKARYVTSQATDLLEVLAVFALNPPYYKFLYDNFEYKRRDYSGLELEVIGKVGNRLTVNASYSHALARGTNPGQTETGSWSQEEGSTNFLGLFGNHIAIPALPELADIKAAVDYLFGGLGGRGIGDEGWYGKLPYSIDHDIKLNVVYDGPWNVLASAAFEYISGYYWEKLGYVPGFGGYYSYPEGRGSRETPPHAYLDLSFEKTFRLPASGVFKEAGLSVRLDVFNVFNSQEPVSYVKEDVPIFGWIWARQLPRQARVSAVLKF